MTPSGRVDGHGDAGVLVGVVDAQVEEDLARFDGLSQVDERGGAPAAITIELGREGVVLLGEPSEAGETVLDFHNLGGFAGEWGLQRHDLVAMSDFPARVAAIECLGPDQPGIVQRLPLDGTRTGRHALAGDVVGDRQVGDRGNRPAVTVPYLGLAAEVHVRHAIREGAADRADQKILLVGREVGAGDQSGRTDPLDVVLSRCRFARAGWLRNAGTGLRRAGW